MPLFVRYSSHTTCTSPIMHVIKCTPKILHNLADKENFKRTFPLTTVYDEFPVDQQNGINKRTIRLIMLLKCKKTN